jgi:hypothetical protein
MYKFLCFKGVTLSPEGWVVLRDRSTQLSKLCYEGDIPNSFSLNQEALNSLNTLRLRHEYPLQLEIIYLHQLEILTLVQNQNWCVTYLQIPSKIWYYQTLLVSINARYCVLTWLTSNLKGLTYMMKLCVSYWRNLSN